MVVDVSFKKACGRFGKTQANASEVDGVVLSQAVDTEREYSEFFETNRCRFVVVSIETRSSRLFLAADDGERLRVTIILAPPGRFDVGKKVDEDVVHYVCGFFLQRP